MDRKILGNNYINKFKNIIVRNITICNIDIIKDFFIAILDQLLQSKLKFWNGDKLIFISIYLMLLRKYKWGKLINEIN